MDGIGHPLNSPQPHFTEDEMRCREKELIRVHGQQEAEPGLGAVTFLTAPSSQREAGSVSVIAARPWPP